MLKEKDARRVCPATILAGLAESEKDGGDMTGRANTFSLQGYDIAGRGGKAGANGLVKEQEDGVRGSW